MRRGCGPVSQFIPPEGKLHTARWRCTGTVDPSRCRSSEWRLGARLTLSVAGLHDLRSWSTLGGSFSPPLNGYQTAPLWKTLEIQFSLIVINADLKQMNCWFANKRLFDQAYLYTMVPSAPWPNTSLGRNDMLPTLTIVDSSSGDRTQWKPGKSQLKQSAIPAWEGVFLNPTSFFTLIRRASWFRRREIGVVGSAGRDVGTAVVRTFRTSAHRLQIVTVLDQAQTNVCRGEWLLSLEQLQPLLHLLLEFLMLQLLLLVNTLWQQDRLVWKFWTYKNTLPVKSSVYWFYPSNTWIHLECCCWTFWKDSIFKFLSSV